MLTIPRDLNVYSSGMPPIISLSQYDSDFQLVFNLYTSEGTLNIPSGTTAQIQGTKRDGNGYSASATISGNTVTVTGHNQMTACAGANIYEISLTNSGKVLNTINFILAVEPAAMDAGTIQSETVLKELQAIIDSAATSTQAAQDAEDAADRAEEAARSLTVDPTLTQSGQPADAKVTGDEINDLKADLSDNDAVLKDDIRTLDKSVLAYVKEDTDWTNGTYDANGYSDLPTQTITNKYSKIFPAGEYIVTPAQGIRWEAYYYNSDTSGTVLFSFGSVERKFVATSGFIITIGRTGGGSLDGLESEIKRFSVVRKNTELEAVKKIQNDSYSIKIDKYKNIEYIDRLEFSSLGQGTALNVMVNNSVVFQGKPYSVQFSTDPTKTNSEMRINYSTAFKLIGTQEFDMAVYIPDATKVTKIRLQLPTASFTKSTETLVNGWNFVRVRTEGGGSWSESVDNTQIRLMAYHEAGAEETIYIGYFAQVKPAYGNMLIVADGPYYTFYTEAYPALKEMGVPVVWALDPTQITESTAQDRQIINTSDLETLATDGMSEFSFHSYDMTLMSNATAEQALADTLNNIRYLNKHGLQSRRIWRAAWLQNNCQHPDLANLELDASASYNGSAGVTEYPFVDRYNIPRYGVASRTTSQIDSIFSKLQNQHCTVVLYFHGISEGSDKEVTPEMLEYFIEKISTALTEGYLNPTTYNRLVSFYKLI